MRLRVPAVSSAMILAVSALWAPSSAQELVYDARSHLGVDRPVAVEQDAAGNLYILCSESENVFKVEPDGTTTQLISGVGAEGQPLATPSALLLDDAGNVYVAGVASDNVFKIEPDGTTSIVLGPEGTGSFPCNAPTSLAMDGVGNLYVACIFDDDVFRVAPDGTVTRLDPSLTNTPRVVEGPAGDVILLCQFSDGTQRIPAGGDPVQILTTIQVTEPIAAESDAAGNVYVLGTGDGDLWKVDPSDVATQQFVGNLSSANLNTLDVAPDGTAYFCGSYLATGNLFNLLARVSPTGTVTPLPINGLQSVFFCAADSTGDVYYMQANNNLAPSTIYRRTATTTDVLMGPDGDGRGNPLGTCFGLFVEPDDEVIVLGSDTVFRIRSDDSIEVVLDRTANGLQLPAARLQGLARHPDTGLFVSVGDNAGDDDAVLRVHPDTGAVSRVLDSTGDGQGNGLDFPRDLAVDAAGNVLVTGEVSDNLFRVSPDGATVELLLDATGDGQGNALNGTHGVVVDSQGNIYVSGALSDNVFKIEPGGAVTEVLDVTGDGMGNGVNDPRGMAVDGFDNVYVACRFSDNVFRISPTGVITEMIDLSGDGLGNALDGPTEVSVSRAGIVYVAGSVNHNVFRVTPAGAVTFLAGPLTVGANPFSGLEGVAVDAFGSLYVPAGISDNVFRIDTGGQATEVFDSNPALLDQPVRVVVDEQERAYVMGNRSNNVWRIDGPPLFDDLGGAIQAPAGPPLLRMRGPLTEGSALDRILSNAPPSQPVLVWIKVGPTTPIPFVPFLGGAVHTFPFNTQLFFFTDVFGDSILSVPWPPATPSGVELSLQFLMEDFTVPGGIGLSNAVQSITP